MPLDVENFKSLLNDLKKNYVLLLTKLFKSCLPIFLFTWQKKRYKDIFEIRQCLSEPRLSSQNKQ